MRRTALLALLSLAAADDWAAFGEKEWKNGTRRLVVTEKGFRLLDGEKTVFLPFNRGSGTGAGNPDNPQGYRAEYLWEQVWQRDSWLDILARFIHLSVEEKTVAGRKIRKETMIFPRYHQLVAVRALESDTRRMGAGTNYLIQHSAGSGKSNSIAWLAHQLSTLHDAGDQRVFDSIVVITDRRVLDRQLPPSRT